MLPGGRRVRLSAVEHTVRGFDRITVDPAKVGAQPCIRGYRFSVEHLLALLAADWTVDEIRADFPSIAPMTSSKS